MRRRPFPILTVACASLVLSAAVTGCSDDEPAGSQRCEVGEWTSTGVLAPSQAGVGEVVSTGGGDGMRIDITADGGFQIDFGPMSPSTGTFDSSGTTGSIATVFSGVGEGAWTDDGTGLVARFDDLSTVTATVTLTLGDTVPPVFDETLEKVNRDRMLDGRQAGVFTATSCVDGALELTMPFPGGDLVVLATHA